MKIMLSIFLTLALTYILCIPFTWLISLCFGFAFTFKIVTGIWLIATCFDFVVQTKVTLK